MSGKRQREPLTDANGTLTIQIAVLKVGGNDRCFELAHRSLVNLLTRINAELQPCWRGRKEGLHSPCDGERPIFAASRVGRKFDLATETERVGVPTLVGLSCNHPPVSMRQNPNSSPSAITEEGWSSAFTRVSANFPVAPLPPHTLISPPRASS